jgi:hypothetical protein
MGFRPPPDCIHADNWRRCKIHTSWLQSVIKDYRPHCIIDRLDRPADGDWFCPDQQRVPRPAPPTTGSGVARATQAQA